VAGSQLWPLAGLFSERAVGLGLHSGCLAGWLVAESSCSWAGGDASPSCLLMVWAVEMQPDCSSEHGCGLLEHVRPCFACWFLKQGGCRQQEHVCLPALLLHVSCAGMKLFGVGFFASLLGVGITNTLTGVRQMLDPAFVPLNPPQVRCVANRVRPTRRAPAFSPHTAASPTRFPSVWTPLLAHGPPRPHQLPKPAFSGCDGDERGVRLLHGLLLQPAVPGLCLLS